MAEGDLQLKLTTEQRSMIAGMKWNVVKNGVAWADIVDNKGVEIIDDLILDEAETIVAAHDAAIDIILEEFK